jgi:hypothetical protein
LHRRGGLGVGGEEQARQGKTSNEFQRIFHGVG